MELITAAPVSFAHSVLDDAPAIRIVDTIHERALAARASDIHIEPALAGGGIRQRVDGTLREVDVVPHGLFLQVVSRIKLLAGMDIADRRQS
ncbi:MAG: Flp pilus assembly complex ATPase component TadA [Candidatus Eremiobacteraeota bacterium]|nr:Flp pilus assembly complex ATPase component TadA [Candidatus Eremiobacteraeota bacterium]